MFILLAVLATVFYSLNSTLLAPIGRNISAVKLNAYRGLSLGILMLPLLLLIPLDGWKAWNIEGIQLMTLTCIVSMLGNACITISQRYLPVGISLALCLSMATIVSTLFGAYALGDSVGSVQISIMAVLIVEALILGAVSTRSTFVGLNVPLGLLLAVGFGLCLGLGYGLVGKLSREYHPLVIGYCWELGTGLISLLLLFVIPRLREQTTYETESIYPIFLRVMVAASPTVIGTGAYAWATTLGPVGIVSAVLSTMGAFGAIFGYFFLREKLQRAQVVMILLMVATLVSLKLSMS